MKVKLTPQYTDRPITINTRDCDHGLTINEAIKIRDDLISAIANINKKKNKVEDVFLNEWFIPAFKKSMINRPTIVCLCGSTKFKEAYQRANLEETLNGKIVLSVGCYIHSDKELNLSDEQKKQLDELHKRKIDLADEIFFLNVDGYMGNSTFDELDYALKTGKIIRFLEKKAPW